MIDFVSPNYCQVSFNILNNHVFAKFEEKKIVSNKFA